MSWRMTVVLPSEIEEAVRKEQHNTRTPISRLIKTMLAERYGIESNRLRNKKMETVHAGCDTDVRFSGHKPSDTDS